MKRSIKRSLGVAGLVGAAACSADLDEATSHRETAEDERYIVAFEDPGAGRAALRAAGAKRELAIRGMDAAAYRIPTGALAGLERDPSIAYIERDRRRYLFGDTVPYGIEMVQADRVSDEGAANRTVCVIDSGYHIDHLDLQDENVTASPDPASGDPFIDSCGHGTHVTGTISALQNGGGVLGVLPSGVVGLHIVKTFGDDDFESGACDYSYSSAIIDAAFECADAGANVINMSLGSGASSETEEQAFEELFDRGILSVAAAGNDGTTQHSFPASYDAVLSVAAIDRDKEVADFSQRNDQVELAAPGVSVLSTTPVEDAALEVAGVTYLVGYMDKSVRAVATGDLADGGLCADQNGAWDGMVVICERGEISFGDKVENVAAAGGVAAVIYNNEPGHFSGTLQRGGNPNFESEIPAVSASQADGQQLVADDLGTSAEVSTEVVVPGDGYGALQGTSMASPHVAGVAALVWSHDPTWTNQEIRDALAQTAEDLGTPGRNDEYGHGLVRARAALDLLLDGDGECSLAIEDLDSFSTDESSGGFAITWTTDEPATSEVTFDCCGTYASEALGTDHRMDFEGSPGATYEYVVGGTATSGCEAEAEPAIHEN